MKKALFWIILISFFGCFSIEILDMNGLITFVSVKTINLEGGLGVKTYMSYDVYRYLSNLSNVLSIDHAPWKAAITAPQGAFGLDLGHDFALLCNWVIYMINILITPLRLIFYPAQVMLGLLGINIYASNGLFTTMVRDLITLEIAYIPL